MRDIRYTAAGMTYVQHRRQEPETAFADYLAEARALMADPPIPAETPQAATDLEVGGDFEGLRWYLLPDEADRELVELATRP